MKTIRTISILALILLFAMSVEGQVRKAGLNSAAFLKVGVGARNVAMGSAGTSFDEDVNAMFWNPAGISLRQFSVQAAFSYNKWIADLNHNAFGVTYKLEDIGTVGLGVIMFGVSGIPAYRDVAPPSLASQQIDQATSDTYDYLDLSIQASFAKDFSDKLSLGATFKYISEKIDDQTQGAIAVDLGSIYMIGGVADFLHDWKISARLTNLGSGIRYYDVDSPIPITFGIGTSFKPMKSDAGELTIAIDAVKPQDSPQLYYVGGEYFFMGMVFLRGGWKFNYSGVEDDGTSTRAPIKHSIEGISFGAGLKTTIEDYYVGFDYAYTAMDILDAAHRITLSVSLK